MLLAEGDVQGEEPGKNESRIQDHLVDVMGQSGKSLTENKKEVLAKLLRDNSDVFPRDDRNIGCISGSALHKHRR